MERFPDNLNILSILPNFVVGINPAGKIVFFNKSAERISGYKSKELMGKDWFKTFTPAKQAAEAKKEFGKLLAKKNPSHFTSSILTKKGEERTLEWDNTYAIDEKGRVQMVIETGIDMTDWVKAENEMKAGEEKFRAIFESSRDAFFLGDYVTMRIVDCNRQAEKLMGYPKSRITQMTVMQMHPPDKVQETLNACSKHNEGVDEAVESEVMTKSGKRVPVSITSSKIMINGRRYVLGAFRDISQRKKSERELKQKMDELKQLNQFLVGREKRIIELKKRVKELEAKKARA